MYLRNRTLVATTWNAFDKVMPPKKALQTEVFLGRHDFVKGVRRGGY